MIPASNEDKQAWCKQAEANETVLAGPLLGGGCAVFMNPAKAENKFTHDVFAVFPADLKQIRTRFNTADRYGVPAKTAFTLNKKDVDRYTKKYPNIILIFDIDYGDYQTVCYATLHDIKKAIRSGAAKLHTYQNRINDTQGNARESYVLDARWFPSFQMDCA